MCPGAPKQWSNVALQGFGLMPYLLPELKLIKAAPMVSCGMHGVRAVASKSESKVPRDSLQAYLGKRHGVYLVCESMRVPRPLDDLKISITYLLKGTSFRRIKAEPSIFLATRC